jgi:hypothetical protein
MYSRISYSYANQDSTGAGYEERYDTDLDLVRYFPDNMKFGLTPKFNEGWIFFILNV